MIFSRLKAILLTHSLFALLAFATAHGETSTLTWTELSPAVSPSVRSYFGMTYDDAGGKVLVFGGLDGHNYLNDTWTFDGSTWTKVDTATSPPARTSCQMAYDRKTRQVVLFGGYNGHYLGDTWLWNGRTLTWTQATPTRSPKAVTGPMVFNDFDGRVVVFGGFDGQFYQDTMWKWHGTNWKQLRLPMVPYARSSSAVGVNFPAKQTVLFAGLADVNPLNTWTYDGQTWTIQSPSTQPLSAYGGSATYDQNLNQVVLFGGANGGVDQDGTWEWTGSNWVQLFPTQSPEAREGAGMVFDRALGRTIVFGGQDREVPMNDTWQLNP